MGIRGELFSTKVQLQNRTYFFNVKENRMGDLYLNIVESKNQETGGFERQSVILFAEDLSEFLAGFEESLRVLEKAVREKKRNNQYPPRSDRIREPQFHGEDHGGGRPERDKRVFLKKAEHRPRPREEEGKPKNRKPRSVKVVRRKDH
jgi:hypothetical protein